jgi:tripartite-type tricarboxylate transporter receptor subunit TctC
MSGLAFILLITIAASCVVSPIALSQDVYPRKRVRVVVPYSVGGAADVTTRIYAQDLSELPGAQFILNFKPDFRNY